MTTTPAASLRHGPARPAMPHPGELPRPWRTSYAPGVPLDVEVPAVSLGEVLTATATAHPDRPALLTAAPSHDDAPGPTPARAGQELTWRELDAEATRVAAVLERLGVRPGERVAVVLPDLVETVALALGTWRHGAVLVPLDPRLTVPELRAALGASGAVAAFVLDERAEEARRAVGLATRCRHLVRVDPWTRGVLARTRRTVAGLVAAPGPRRGLPLLDRLLSDAAGGPVPVRHDVAPDAVAAVLHTGGTTGAPTGVALTHRNLVANAHQCRAWLPEVHVGQETLLLAPPLHHAYGMTVGLLAAMLVAARVVLVPRPTPAALLDAARATRATILPAVPAQVADLAAAATAAGVRLDDLRVCLAGGAPLRPAVVDAFAEVSGARVREGYGLSEASPLTHATPLSGPARPGWIGVPVPGTVAAVVDPDDPWVVLGPGEVGELAIHGPQVRDPGVAETPRGRSGTRVVDGWLLTGDLAERSADGWFRIVGRAKDVVVTSGVAVHPDEVEAVLVRHPDVVAAAVVGAPDERRGEVVVAHLVPRDAATFRPGDVVAFARRRLAPHKVPRRLEVHAELPVSRLGELRRDALRSVGRGRVTHHVEPDP